MCLSLPGRVECIEGPQAMVETTGVQRWCNSLMLPELKVGDRVIVHAGLVLEVVTEEQARDMELAFAELASLRDQAVDDEPAVASPAGG